MAFSLTPHKSEYAKGDRLLLSARISNTGRVPFTFRVCAPGWSPGNGAAAIDYKSWTATGRSGADEAKMNPALILGSGRISMETYWVTLEPGMEHNFEIDLGYFLILEAGKTYSVSAICPIEFYEQGVAGGSSPQPVETDASGRVRFQIPPSRLPSRGPDIDLNRSSLQFRAIWTYPAAAKCKVTIAGS
jgi:hypothetical protein